MEKQKVQNYNFEGVDLNIYTAKRSDDIEYYADKLDYLKESHRGRYNMITDIIEMSWMVTHDLKNIDDNYEKNQIIRQVSSLEDEKILRTLNKIIGAFTK